MSSKLILRRIGLGILTLWLVSLVVFAAVIALPGDAATAILGKEATPDRVAALRDQLHLNESVVSQYTQWLKGILTFNHLLKPHAPLGPMVWSHPAILDLSG